MPIDSYTYIELQTLKDRNRYIGRLDLDDNMVKILYDLKKGDVLRCESYQNRVPPVVILLFNKIVYCNDLIYLHGMLLGVSNPNNLISIHDTRNIRILDRGVLGINNSDINILKINTDF